MTSPRLPRFAACLLAGIGLWLAPAAMADGFSTQLTAEQRTAAGLDQLNAGERAALDADVAGDLGNARQLRVTTLGERFSLRHAGGNAGLGRLSAQQLAQLDELVADAIAAQPLPKERPRLKDDQVVSLKRRLEVHGGMSFTYGWAKGGRNYRDAGAWVSYFDPETGLGLEVGMSRFSGDLPVGYGYGYGYGGDYAGPYAANYPYYGGYGYGAPYGFAGWASGAGTTTDVNLFWVRPNFMLSLGFSNTDFSRPLTFEKPMPPAVEKKL